MKKLFFSALAVVAFAGSAFAANEVVEKKAIILEPTCDLVWDLAYRLNRSEGKTVADSKIEADNAKKNCENGSGQNGSVTQNAFVLSRR